MPDIIDVIDAIFPADGQKGVVLGTQIFVLFDQEIDETTIEEGGIFVVGPDTDTFSGPDLAQFERPAGHALVGPEESILESPNYQGIVQGTWTFERIDLLVATSGVTTEDVTGDGTLYRTKAIFTPDIVLTADTTYTVYVIGDEDQTDDVETGVKPRTVFDPEHMGTGSSGVLFPGTYVGSFATDVYNLTIVDSGVKRTATFTWFRTSKPSDVFGPVLTDKKVFLADGVFAEFGDGIFIPGDIITVVTVKQTPFDLSTFWTFDTGSGDLIAVPDDISTSAIGNLVPVTVAIASADFDVTKMTPKDRSTNLPITTNQIVIEFSSDVDPATVTSERVKIFGTPVNGDETGLFSTQEIFKDLTVSGKLITVDF